MAVVVLALTVALEDEEAAEPETLAAAPREGEEDAAERLAAKPTDCAEMCDAVLDAAAGAAVFFTKSAGKLGAGCEGGKERLGGPTASFGCEAALGGAPPDACVGVGGKARPLADPPGVLTAETLDGVPGAELVGEPFSTCAWMGRGLMACGD